MANKNPSKVESTTDPLASVSAFLELRVLDSSGQSRWPFGSQSLDFVVGQSSWSVTLAGDVLKYRCGETVVPGRIGQEVALGQQARVRMVDLRAVPPFWLVAISPDLQYQTWPVDYGGCTIGRPGKRANTISFNHRSISRAHASIMLESGKALLRSESRALTAVNNKPVAFEDTVELRHNDILQLGDLHLRWEKEGGAPPAKDEAYLTIKALGQTRVWLEGREVRWQRELARDLFLWLAACKDTELPVARVMEEYWPKQPAARQTKNLGDVLRGMQTDLGLNQSRFGALILRTPLALRLSSSAVAACDFWAMRGLTFTNTFEDIHMDLGGLFFPRNERAWAQAFRLELLQIWFEFLKKAEMSESQRTRVLDNVTEILRDLDYEDSIQESAFALADALDASSHGALWLKEAVEHKYGSALDARVLIVDDQPAGFPSEDYL